MNSLGPTHLWTQGDGVLHAIAALLVAMSLASWVVMLGKAIDLWRIRRGARRLEHSVWHRSAQALGACEPAAGVFDPFQNLARAAQAAVDHHRRGPRHESMSLSEWLTRCLKNTIDEAIDRSQAGLAMLASVGATAPFVGLLGTVWGIHHALLGIGSAGQATVDQVAGPVGEALVMTALGLFVAIPAVLGYNAIQRGNRRVVARLNRFAHELHAHFVTGARVSAAPAKPSQAAAPVTTPTPA